MPLGAAVCLQARDGVILGRKRCAALRKMGRPRWGFRKQHCTTSLPGHPHDGEGQALFASKSATSRSVVPATEKTGLRKTNPEGGTPGAGHLHFTMYVSFQVPRKRLSLVAGF